MSNTSVSWRTTAQEWRKQWRVGLAAMLGAGVAFSVWPSVSSLFIAPLEQAFGWTRGEIALAQNASLLAAFTAPALGRLIDRIGVRPVLLTGSVLTVLCYVLLACLNGSLPAFYLTYALFSVIGVATTGLTFTRVVTGAFVESRGFALAVTRSGLAVAGALLPSLIFYVISSHGWRAGYLAMGALILLITLPTAWLWIKPTVIQAPGRGKTQSPAERPESWLSLLKNRKVLLICAASALTYAPIVALMMQLHPMLMGKGIEPIDAASAIGLLGISAFVGALLTGVLVDRIWAPLIACVFTLGPALGCVLLLPDALDRTSVVVAVVLLGLGQGAEIDVVAFMIARYFGLRSYASIYGLSVLAISICVAVGASLVGLSYDHFGSYHVALIGAACCFVVAAFSYLAMGRYPAADSPAPRLFAPHPEDNLNTRVVAQTTTETHP